VKINYRNTALGLLDHIDPYSFTMSEDGDHSTREYKTQVGLSIVQEFPKAAQYFKNKIQYISDPFHQAYEKGAGKLASVLDAEPIHESGTFISSSTPSETNTIFYHLKSEGTGADFKLNAIIFFFCKNTKMEKPSLAIIVQKNERGFKEYLSEVAVKNGMDSMTVIADIFTLILFMKYCETETKIIGAGKKAIHAGQKYVNESRYKVEILDSTWFTTIVKSEGFHVRGHFRMQPYGPNMSQRKLIWITDFEKDGYTRTAKVLQQ
jgi:hypothetical protein